MNNKRLLDFFGYLSFLIYFIIVFIKTGMIGGGLLGLTLLLYYVIYIVFIDGVGNTMARMVAVRIKRGFKDNARKIFGYVMFYTFLAGTAALAGFVLAGNDISDKLFSNEGTGAVVSIIGLLFLIHGLSHNIKCYYIGCGGHILLFIADIVSMILLPAGTFYVIDLFLEHGTKVAAIKNDTMMTGIYGAIGAMLVLCAANLLRLLILLAGLRSVTRAENYSFNEVRTKDGVRTFLRSFFPEYIKYLRKNIAVPLMLFINAMIYSRVGFSTGVSREDVYSQIGCILGPGLAFCFFFIKNYNSYAAIMQAKLKSGFKKEDRKGVTTRFNSYAKNVVIIVIPLFITMLIMAGAVSGGIFKASSDEITKLGMLASLIFLFSSLDAFFYAGLRATGFDTIGFLGEIAGFVLALVYVLMSSRSGIKMSIFVVSLIIFFAAAMLIHGFFALSNIGLRSYDLGAKTIKVIISALPMLIVELLLVKLVTMNVLIIAITVLVGYLLYFLILVLTRGMNQKELGGLQGAFIYYPINFFMGMFHIR
ncbi:MAG: hypothetical protein K5877_07320 [Lachnospiraceae bacterium]|nr:hypothetical protein [Lachnospiraceae bacterium]